MSSATNGTLHRANYIRELGEWRATCRWCGWTVVNTERRQAASQFRIHIRDSRLIDLRDQDEYAAGPSNEPAAPQVLEG